MDGRSSRALWRIRFPIRMSGQDPSARRIARSSVLWRISGQVSLAFHRLVSQKASRTASQTDSRKDSQKNSRQNHRKDFPTFTHDISEILFRFPYRFAKDGSGKQCCGGNVIFSTETHSCCRDNVVRTNGSCQNNSFFVSYCRYTCQLEIHTVLFKSIHKNNY